MRRYAEGTQVPVEKTRSEIEAVLRRYGASEFASGWAPTESKIMFVCKTWRVRFILPLPAAVPPKKGDEPRGWEGWNPEKKSNYVQRMRDGEECRRWRALLLVIKAKLEAIASGITTFENEFLAHIVIPGGETVGEKIAAQLEGAYKTGKMPPLLGAGG